MEGLQLKKTQSEIEDIWKNREKFNDCNLKKTARIAIKEVIELLDSGKIRVAEKLSSGEWVIHKWIKQAILLHFLTEENKIIDNTNCWFDKIGNKFSEWNEEKFHRLKIRAVPGCFVRRSAYIGTNVVLMPSFINVGAYVDSGTMIDTWSTIGSCAQIGKNCHISGGVGIGGVLEPIQASPVIIEDNCFIGARSEVAEGVVVREGSVLGMGVFIGASTKIIDRETSNHIESFINAGADIITVHAKAEIHLERLIRKIKSYKNVNDEKKPIQVGVSIVPSTSPSVLEYIIHELDIVLIMTVNPGFGGQEFIHSQLNKISTIKKMIQERNLKTQISVDGGINFFNAADIIKAGADILVAGSAIFKAEDIKKAINDLKNLLL